VTKYLLGLAFVLSAIIAGYLYTLPDQDPISAALPSTTLPIAESVPTLPTTQQTTTDNIASSSRRNYTHPTYGLALTYPDIFPVLTSNTERLARHQEAFLSGATKNELIEYYGASIGAGITLYVGVYKLSTYRAYAFLGSYRYNITTSQWIGEGTLDAPVLDTAPDGSWSGLKHGYGDAGSSYHAISIARPTDQVVLEVGISQVGDGPEYTKEVNQTLEEWNLTKSITFSR
jgi:hypothetical protein